MNDGKKRQSTIEETIRKYWREKGNASIISARHTEFVIEPKIFIGDQLNPEILKMLVAHYLMLTSRQDSGVSGNIEVSSDKLIIKSPKGKPLVIVRDKKIISQYIASKLKAEIRPF